jgi:hypothetical protein
VRVRQERREPGEAGEHHHRPQPVARPLTPSDQTAPDERPADQQRERPIGGLVRREIAVRRKPGRPHPGSNSRQRHQNLSSHGHAYMLNLAKPVAKCRSTAVLNAESRESSLPKDFEPLTDLPIPNDPVQDEWVTLGELPCSF